MMKRNGREDMNVKSILKRIWAFFPSSMRPRYRIILLIVLGGAVTVIVLSYLSLLGCDSQAVRLIQILTGLAIATAAIVALSNTDPSVRKINAQVKPYIAPQDTGKETYHKAELSDELKKFYAKFPDPFDSYKVQFEITNNSDFDWVKPVATFWLPVGKQAPDKDNRSNPEYAIRQYRSNTFNTKIDLKMLEMVDGVIISNSNLPYWKQKKHITIWLRMVLQNEESEPFDVEVSVDCEDADGYTQPLRIDPKKLLKDINKTPENPLGKISSYPQ
jgi:hypothetical protein